MVQSHVYHLSSSIMQNLCCNEPGDNWFRLSCGICNGSTVYCMMLCTSMLLRLFCWPRGWFICGTLLRIIRITRTKTTVAQEACPRCLSFNLGLAISGWILIYGLKPVDSIPVLHSSDNDRTSPVVCLCILIVVVHRHPWSSFKTQDIKNNNHVPQLRSSGNSDFSRWFLTVQHRCQPAWFSCLRLPYWQQLLWYPESI